MALTFYEVFGTPVTDSEYAFETYSNYVQAYSHLIRENGDIADFAEFVLSNTTSIQRDRTRNLDYILEYLSIGWNTEFLLRLLMDTSPNLLRIMNHWKPVQAYYVIYAIGNATLYALQGDEIKSHSKAIRGLSNKFAVENNKFKPWCYASVRPIGKRENSHQIKNFPNGTTPSHNLSNPLTDPKGVVACCLKALHKKRVKEGYKDAHTYKYLHNPGPTTIFHFLYRMRIKCNYQDVVTFTTKAPSEKIIGFCSNIVDICNYTSCLLEIHILRKIGLSSLEDIYNKFNQLNPDNEALANRISIYGDLIRRQ